MYGRIITTLVLILFLLPAAGPIFAAETWTLGQQEQWQSVSENSQAGYMLAVSRLKELINQGKVDELIAAVEQLKKDYPEIAGPDLDAFLEGEKQYAKGNLVKAIRAYDSFLTRYPQSALYEAALSRELDIARAYLGGHKKTVLKIFKIKGYAEGVKIADNVIDRAGDSPIAVRASKAVAESYEQRGLFEEAYERWSAISTRWPTGEIGKEALLSMARTKHAAYRGPKYDASNLVSAKSYYENFQMRYPEDARRYEIGKRLEQITEQMAYKDYKIAEYYDRTGSDEAAKYYSDVIVEEWPRSTAARMTKENIIDKNEQAKAKQEKK